MSKTILYVDDEPAIHEAAEREFHNAGDHLVHAGDGLKAINYFLAHRDIDAIITDLYMEHDGLELIQKIRDIDDQVPITVVSGGNCDGDQYRFNAGQLIGGNLVLEKPMSSRVLLGILNRLVH